MKPFKDAVCLNGIPDVQGYRSPPRELCCKRRKKHPGKCRVKFRDGKYREWNRGDKESVIVEKPT